MYSGNQTVESALPVSAEREVRPSRSGAHVPLVLALLFFDQRSRSAAYSSIARVCGYDALLERSSHFGFGVGAGGGPDGLTC